MSYGAGVAASVVSSALLLRHLGVVATGHYITVVSLVALALGVTDAGVVAIGVHELSTLPAEDARRFFSGLLGLRLALGAGGILLAALFALIAGYSTVLLAGTLIAGVGFALSGWQVIYSVPLLTALRLGWVAAMELIRQLVTAIAVIVLVLAGAPLLSFWAATIPAGLAVTAFTAALIYRSTPLVPTIDRVVWAPLIRRVLPYSVATAVGVVYFRLAILIVSNVASAEQAGYYAASFRVIEVLFILPQLIVGSSLPIFSRAARDDPGRLDLALGRTFDVCLLAGLAAGLILISGAPFIIGLVAGPHFAPAASVLRVQSVGLVATFLVAVFSYGLLSLGRYRALLSINVTVLVLSGVSTAVLAGAFGAVGAASATAIVEVLYAAMLGVALLRAGVRPTVSIDRALRASIAALLGVLVLLPTGLPTVVRPLLATVIYGTVLLALDAVPSEIMELISLQRRGQRS